MVHKIDVKSLVSVRFLSAVIILASSAAWLRPAMQKLSIYYEKTSIAIRRPLKDFDISRLPSFKTGWEYKWLTAPVEDVGTDEYVHIAFIKGRHSLSLSRAELFVTYYSDPQDKVPHTPEVCARQAGAIVRKLSTIMLDIPQLAPENQRIKARLLFLEYQKFNTVVIYVFCVEGQFKYSREQVRWMMAMPGNKHVYFSKIDAAIRYPTDGDPDEVVPLCKQLICEAIPLFVAEYFPSKEQLKQR